MSQSFGGTTSDGLPLNTFGSMGLPLGGTKLATEVSKNQSFGGTNKVAVVSKDQSFGGTNLATGERLVSKDQSFGGANIVTTGDAHTYTYGNFQAIPLPTVDWAKGQRCFNKLKSRFVRLGEKLPNGKTPGFCSFCGLMNNEAARTVYHLRIKHFHLDMMEFVCPQVNCDHTAPSSALMLDHMRSIPDHVVTVQSVPPSELVKFIRPKEALQ